LIRFDWSVARTFLARVESSTIEITSMIASVKVLVLFVCMVFLIRRKVPIGYVLLIDAVLAAALFKMDPGGALRALGSGAFSLDTLYLIAVMLLIIGMGNVMKAMGSFDRAIESLEALLADTRAVMAVVPAIIGFLPMPGGAMLSAPMVGTVARRTQTSGAQNTAINFWFRHVWEYVWPLYPGIILTAALLEIPVRNVAAVNFPLTCAAITGGLLFSFRGVVPPELSRRASARAGCAKQLAVSLSPIIAVVVATVVFSVPLLLSLGVVCALLLIVHRLNKEQLRTVAHETVTAETIFLIVGVKVFEAVIERSGAASEVVQSFVSIDIVPAVLVVTVPFVLGVLTGATIGFVGVTFPVLMPFFVGQAGDVAYRYVMLAYAAGFTGVLFSPVHLCLVMTKDYFKAEFGQVYRLLIAPSLVVILVAVGWFLFGVEAFVRRTGL